MNKTKTILIISAVFPPEPVVSAIISHDLALSLSDRHNVIVLSPRPSRPAGYSFPDKPSSPEKKYKHVIVESYICPQSSVIGRFYESISFGIHSARFIRQNHQSLDAIYLNSWPIFSQYSIIRQAKHYKIPSVLHYQDIYPESFLQKIRNPLFEKICRSLLFPIDKYISKNSSKIVAISDNMKNHLVSSRMIDDSKVSVVLNWQDETAFSKVDSTSTIHKDPDQTVFMYLGNIGPVARVEWLIKSFATSANDRMKLIIAGSGSRKEACIEEANKYKDVLIEFTSVPDGKVAETQALADVMILAVAPGAAMSSIPSKVPAYMFSKKPIIAAVDMDSDTAHTLMDSKGGIVVSPDDASALSDAFRSFSQLDVSMRNKMADNNYQYAMKWFSKTNNLNTLTHIVESVL